VSESCQEGSDVPVVIVCQWWHGRDDNGGKEHAGRGGSDVLTMSFGETAMIWTFHWTGISLAALPWPPEGVLFRQMQTQMSDVRCPTHRTNETR
jgi:hypothetical protein